MKPISAHLVSVVIPCYNNSKTIARALTSVLNQTYKHIEVVVVDDFSQDFELSEQILNEFSKSFPLILLRHESNRNGAAARNSGMRAASGKYLAFLDADDEWLPDHISNLVKLANDAVQDNVIYYSKIHVKGITGNYTLPAHAKPPELNVAEYLFCGKGFMQTSGFFFSSRYKEELLFNESFRRHQDYDFLFNAERKGFLFVMSDHIGVILHWEGNNIERKGGGWTYSLEWAGNYRERFSPKAFSCFILKTVVWPLLRKGERINAMRIYNNNIKTKHLPRVFMYVTLKLFLFKK